ncbi:MAG: hypothetical protein HY293_12140 [Planctomycetes bacterium]|nr:hypothetical protein [Planctomycetota bacterium]
MRLLLALGLLLQAAPDDVDDLVRLLRSDRAEERDAAAKKLTGLGAAAAPALEALRKDRDEEVARRVADILREIDRQERLKALRKAGRVRSAEIKNATLERAAAEVFGGFGVRTRFEPFGLDLGITAVTLQFKDAGFWEAVDLFCAAAVVRFEPEFGLADQLSELTFSRPLPWPVHFDTLGDVRVYAGLIVMAGGRANHGDLTARLRVAFAPWAVPKKARIEEVRIAGQALEENAVFGNDPKGGRVLTREAEKLTIAGLWWGGDCAKRDLMKGAATVAVQGTLVILREAGEERLPFEIPGLSVPPVPAR